MLQGQKDLGQTWGLSGLIEGHGDDVVADMDAVAEVEVVADPSSQANPRYSELEHVEHDQTEHPSNHAS